MSISWQFFLAFLGGALVAGIMLWFLARQWILNNEKKAEEKIEFAKRDAYLQAQNKNEQYKASFDKRVRDFETREQKSQSHIVQRERELKILEQKLKGEFESVEDKIEENNRAESELRRKKNNLENLRQLYRKRLMQVTHLNEKEAEMLLKEEITSECEREIREIRKEMLGKATEEFETEARRILIDTMQRLAVMPSTNMSAVIIKLPNEEMKGRIIGKEGRNIKSFESATGTTLLIDESPGTVLISSFDPIRREIARLSLETLVQDGRIHPVSIEETIQKAQNQLDQKVLRLGENALHELNISGVGREVVILLGKLHYRLSNNQNTLEHSMEVAHLCSLIASELSLDPEIARRCGLFHDLGKAISCENGDSHASAAANLLKRYGEDSRVVNAVASSHGDEIPESVYAEILKVADCISATRPGARSETIDGYVQRIKNLERIAYSFEGVEDAYAIQAGKEVRVIVSPDSYNDESSIFLAGQIRRKIEEDLTFPGKIKVTVIREQRFVETAC